MGKKITTIPASLDKFTSEPVTFQKKRRVAGYARVSTDKDEQMTSYEAQVDYYTKYIESRSDWEFAGVYTDEGITGTNTKKREGFNRMIADAMNGKIDLIVTKSVSRFARNTVDSLTTVRSLKEKGVEIYFEKENIWTLDSKGELLITIMSSLAQEESRSISENVTWAHRKRFAEGKVSFAYTRFLGYDLDKDGNVIINQEEAKVVREIYALHLQGMPYNRIAKVMEEKGYISSGGSEKWHGSTIKAMLMNEKYKGDALLQKKYTVSFLTKEQKKNNGEVPQYYVENNHEPIVTPEVWQLAQDLIKQRSGSRYPKNYHFSEKVKCGKCGVWFGMRTWHSNSKYKRQVLQCKNKHGNNSNCGVRHVYPDDLKRGFILAVNKLLKNKKHIIDDLNLIKESVFDLSSLDESLEKSASNLRYLKEQISGVIEDNALHSQEQEVYQKRYESLVAKYQAEKENYESLEEQLEDKSARKLRLEFFIGQLNDLDVGIQKFDPYLWNLHLDYVEVNEEGDLKYVFQNGIEIEE